MKKNYSLYGLPEEVKFLKNVQYQIKGQSAQ